MLGQSEIEKHEFELKNNGSISAALTLARDAIENLVSDSEALRKRRDFILEYETKGSREVAGLLCLISGHLGDYRFCDHFLEGVEEAGDPYFGFELYRILNFRNVESSISEKYLRGSADRGYLPARKELIRKKMQPFGPIGRVGTIAYSIYLAVCASAILLRDSKDKRLPRV